MRKLGFFVVMLLVLAMSTSVFAKTQFANRGTMALSGGVSLSIDSEKPDVDSAEWDTTTTLTLAPWFGYFVIDGLLVGGSAAWAVAIPESEDSDNLYLYGLSPMVAYYANVGGTLFLGGGASIGYAGASYGKSSVDGWGLKLFGGPTLAFGNKFGGFVSLLAYFGYTSASSEKEGELESAPAQLGAAVGIMSEIGIFF